MLPIIEANRAELVTSDHELNDHIRLTPTPGHTPDHFAVCAGKGGDKAVFTGDLIHSPMQARYPDWSCGSTPIATRPADASGFPRTLLRY